MAGTWEVGGGFLLNNNPLINPIPKITSNTIRLLSFESGITGETDGVGLTVGEIVGCGWLVSELGSMNTV